MAEQVLGFAFAVAGIALTFVLGLMWSEIKALRKFRHDINNELQKIYLRLGIERESKTRGK